MRRETHGAYVERLKQTRERERLQVDAPAHFVPGGRTIEKLSCGELVGVAVAVIDVSAACALDEDYLCDEAAIAADEAAHGAIERGTLALVRTGWAEARYADAARYLNAPDAADLDEYTQLPRMHFPGLTVGAAERSTAQSAAFSFVERERESEHPLLGGVARFFSRRKP